MKTIALVLVLLSQQGHWFGGRVETVRVRRVGGQCMPNATLTWELKYGPVRLASGLVVMPAGDPVAKIRITPPTVRVATDLSLTYRVCWSEAGDELARGKKIIHLYPRDFPSALAEACEGQRLLVWDEEDGLPAVLDEAGVSYKWIRSAAGLRFRRVDLILVGRDQMIGAGPLARSGLIEHARRGASVLILRQGGAQQRAEHPPTGLADADPRFSREGRPRVQHKRLFDPEAQTRKGTTRTSAKGLWRTIALRTRKFEDGPPTTNNAVVSIRAMGRGHIMLFPMPPGFWKRDPRNRLLLTDALEYLLKSVSLGAMPSQRVKLAPRPMAASVPTITIPSGGTP